MKGRKQVPNNPSIQQEWKNKIDSMLKLSHLLSTYLSHVMQVAESIVIARQNFCLQKHIVQCKNAQLYSCFKIS